jgi:D-3-phosphoglycerate dehydrogenase
MGRIAALQLLDALDGKRPPRIVSPEAWLHYARRFKDTFGLTPGQAERQLAGE